MSAEPGLTQLILDSLAELRAAVAKVAEQQATLSLQAERAQRTLVSQVDHDDLEKRLDDLVEKVNSHGRVVWLLTILGGAILAICTAVTISAIDRLIDAAQHDQPQYHAPAAPKPQRITHQPED